MTCGDKIYHDETFFFFSFSRPETPFGGTHLLIAWSSCREFLGLEGFTTFLRIYTYIQQGFPDKAV